MHQVGGWVGLGHRVCDVLQLLLGWLCAVCSLTFTLEGRGQHMLTKLPVAPANQQK
jgi:hypothetical protein